MHLHYFGIDLLLQDAVLIFVYITMLCLQYEARTYKKTVFHCWCWWCTFTVLECSSERRLGDLEVALTLEDFGPIVQPTVQLDAEQKLVRFCACLLWNSTTIYKLSKSVFVCYAHPHCCTAVKFAR